jgi:predicted metal-dependent enzyme (double-stranded beta helix superfamily)
MSQTAIAPPPTRTSLPADQELLSLVRKAVVTNNEGRIVSMLKEGLVDMARRGSFDNFEFPAPAPDRYSRRLVYSDAWERFTIIAMTWGVGHRTPLHDHAGVWCVEVVVDGDMEVVNYQLMEETANGLCRFEKRGTARAHPASSGALIPPFEHHIFGNCGTQPSHTLHIYGGPMNRCNTFQPVSEGWFQRQSRELRYDAQA